MSKTPQPMAAQRILIVRPSALGDVCRTVPVLATLRRAYPEAEIDWLVQDSFIDAIAAHPALTRAVPFPRGRFSRWWRSAAVARELFHWVGEVRGRQYDIVYDFQGLSRSGAMTRLSAAPRRVGFRNSRELGWLGYNIRHPAPQSRHIVDQMLELLEREGLAPVRDMRLYSPPEASQWWWEQRTRAGLAPGAAYAVLAPTSRWSTKNWPIERWSSLLDPLRTRGFEHLVVIGGPGEQAQVERLFQGTHAHVIDLVGATTVGQTMAVVEAAALIIANDSAPLHMAVGFDRPLLGLFGPTDPTFVGPYKREDAVVRVHDPQQDEGIHFRRSSRAGELMARITVEMVLQRLDAILAGPGRAPAPKADIRQALTASGLQVR